MEKSMNDLSNVVFPTIPTVAEFIDPTVTEAGFKDALKRLIEYIETLEQKVILIRNIILFQKIY